MLHSMQLPILSFSNTLDLVVPLTAALVVLIGVMAIWAARNRGVHPIRWPLLGMVPDILLNFHHYYDWTTHVLAACGGSFQIYGPKFSNFNYYMTTNPLNLEHVFKDNFSNFPKGHDFTQVLHDVLGHGIVNADGDTWRVQRKAASLQVTTSAHRAFSDAAVIAAVTHKLVPVLHHLSRRGGHVDLQDIFLRFTFDTMCHVGFGAADVACLSEDLPRVPFAEAFEHTQECCTVRFFLPPTWWKLLRRLRIGKLESGMPAALKTINQFVLEMMSGRRKKEAAANLVDHDLLTCFMKVDQISAANDDTFVKDMCMSFLLAGRDTSAIALSWFFWLVATHPEKQAKLLEEIDAVMGAANEVLSREAVSRMSYLHAALSETLRLFPAAPFLIKSVLHDDLLPDGHRVNRGDKVAFNVYAMGRTESIWGPDCREFRPERWLDAANPGQVIHVSPFKYPVFNAGPRTCLGKDMAYFLMKAVACSVLYRFKVELVPDHQVTPKISAILYMKHGILVTLKSRVPSN